MSDSKRIVAIIYNNFRNIESISSILQKYYSSLSDENKEKFQARKIYAYNLLTTLKQRCPQEFAYAKLLYSDKTMMNFFAQGDMQTVTQTTYLPPCCTCIGNSPCCSMSYCFKEPDGSYFCPDSTVGHCSACTIYP